MNAMTDNDEYRGSFYRAVDQRQANDARQQEYYVPIYDRPELQTVDVVQELFDAIRFTGGASVQFLSGYKGTGKSSELRRLAGVVQATGRPVVYMTIENYASTELPLDMSMFPIMLAAGFVGGVGLEEDVRQPLRDRLKGFFTRIKVTPSIDLGTAGFDVKLALAEDTSFAKQVADVVRNNRLTFMEEFHQFFTSAVEQIGLDVSPLFIVDSIDHFRGRDQVFQEVRESVDRAFSELVEELQLPSMHVIYTLPVYVKTELGIKHEVLNIKVSEPDGQPYEPGLAALRDVLTKRAPDGDLDRLVSNVGDRLITKTGGSFRDLLRLTGQVLLTTRNLPASEADFGRAERDLRSDFEGVMSAEKADILRAIQDSHQLEPKEDEWPDVIDLMTRGAILRYPNHEKCWYGVNPLLVALL